MTALAEFLQHSAARVREDERKRNEAYERWDSSVTALFDELERWVRASDPAGQLALRRERYFPYGPEGRSQWRLLIGLGDLRVRVEARSPSVMGGVEVEGTPNETPPLAGRVELVGGDRTEVLLLVRDGGADRWFVRHTANRMRPLDEATFTVLLAGVFRDMLP